jgi:hypothetical protein
MSSNNNINSNSNTNYNTNSNANSNANNDSDLPTPELEEQLTKLINIDYTYPLPNDKEFQEKIYRKREFYYHKIPGRDELKDYNDVKEYRDKICTRKFALQEHQALLSNFINPDTPYKGILVFHGTGTGKTCVSITIAERFKPMIQKYGTKIYVLMSGPLIKENFKRELLTCTGETYLKQQDATVYVSQAETAKANKNALNIALQYYRLMSYRSFYKKVLGEKIVEKVKTKDNKIKASYRKTKDGEFERDISIDRIYNLNNSVIIVDEAHNLTGNAYGEALMKIIKNSINLKIILLTATPMKNLADDIVELLNFIRPPRNPIERDKIFSNNKNHLMELKPGGKEYFKKMATGYVSYLRGADPITFAKRVEMGEIPEGLLFTKIIRCKMLKFQRSIYDEAIKVKDDTLDRRSEAVANFAFPGLSSDHKSIVGYYGREGVNVLKTQLKTHYEQLNKKIATDILNIGDNSGLGSGELLYISDNQKTVTGNILKFNNLKNFSIKFYKALKKINRLVWGKKGAKTAFIYSNLVKVGIELFQEILMQNGYLEYDDNRSNYKISQDTICYFCGKTYREHTQQNIKASAKMSRADTDINTNTVITNKSESSTEYNKTSDIELPEHEFFPATFISVTGKSADEVADIIPEDKKQLLDNVFSNIENKEGKYIKFVLGSKVMSEAISLKHVAEVHILDVYFNLGKVDQVIGRAIRHCSHFGVTNDKNRYPVVKVYKYAVSLGNTADNKSSKELSSEEDLYKKAEQKYILIKKMERMMKEIAIDCPLNRHGNLFPEELKQYDNCVEPANNTKISKDQIMCPSICDYTNCYYKCDGVTLNNKYYDVKTGNYRKLNNNELDRSTFTHSLARNEIDTVKNKIKDLYRVKYVYTLKDIVKNIKNSYHGEKKELFEDFFVFKALDELIPVTENDFNNFKDTIFDKFNRAGYLIYIDKYYIFQPFDQNEDVPMYYRSTYDKNVNNKLTLYNYMKNTSKFVNMKQLDIKKKEKTEQPIFIYDFNSTTDYYDNRDEFKYVGIIDKEPSRKKNKQFDELQDVFKIREKRDKILDKKRGTGIASVFGAVCETSKSKEYLIDIANSINIKLSGNEIRNNICAMIKERLLFLEKYGSDKKKNKLTYIMIPANHKLYPFPYNLEDRKNNIITKIKDKIKFKIDIVVKENDKTIKGEHVTTYTITIKNNKQLDEYKTLFTDIGFTVDKDKYSITIE